MGRGGVRGGEENWYEADVEVAFCMLRAPRYKHKNIPPVTRATKRQLSNFDTQPTDFQGSSSHHSNRQQ